MSSKQSFLKTFYTPIFTKKVGLDEEEYKQLSSVLYNLEGKNWENQQPSQPIENGVYESPHQLFQRPEPEIQIIAKTITKQVIEIVKDINQYSEEQIKKINCFAASWFHITRENGFVQPHNHPNASWSAVFCVDEGNEEDKVVDTSLVLMTPSEIPMYIDAGNMNINLPLASDTIRFNLRKGDLIIFPSNLMHFVTPHLSKNPRITIATNFWFT